MESYFSPVEIIFHGIMQIDNSKQIRWVSIPILSFYMKQLNIKDNK